jgi:hypothetical protein
LQRTLDLAEQMHFFRSSSSTVPFSIARTRDLQRQGEVLVCTPHAQEFAIWGFCVSLSVVDDEVGVGETLEDERTCLKMTAALEYFLLL